MGRINCFKLYKNFFAEIKNIQTQIEKNIFFIFYDIINCKIKYRATYTDYKIFEMYKLNEEQRSTILTNGINRKIIKKYNNPAYRKNFTNQTNFNKKFNKYLLRNWIELSNNKESYNEFLEFCKKYNKIIVKSIQNNNEIAEIQISNENNIKTYTNLIKKKKKLIEEDIIECKEISKINPNSLNSIKFITLNQKIIVAYLCMGNNNYLSNNFDNNALIAPINIETGIIDYLAVDKKGNTYDRHPLTNEQILWFKIPKWPRMKRFVIQISKKIPEIGYAEWNICLGEKDPILISGTDIPTHTFYQLPPHRTKGIGLLPKFLKEIEEKGENKNEDIYSN